MNRLVPKITAAVLCIILVGCPNQSALASLTSILGNAAASVADLQGNTQLAQKLKTDTAAAVVAVENWKAGTPAQEAIEALNLVEDDLNLFPVADPYGPLIDLAIGTVESILALLPQPTAAPAVVRHHRKVHLNYPAPKTAKQFKAQWNMIAPPNAKIK